jgi:hypothetical protein
MTALPLLNEKNWASWKLKVTGRLHAKGVFHCLRTPPTAAMATPAPTSIEESKAFGILFEALDDNQYQHVEGCTNVSDAYENLRAHHEPTCWVTRLALEDQWSSLNWNHKQEDFNAFLGRFRDLVRRLTSCGATVDEAAQTAKLLKCLPKEMNGVYIMVQLQVATARTLKFTVPIVEAEYTRLLDRGELRPPTGYSADERALNAKGKTDPKSGKHDTAKKPKCNYCGYLGHKENECRRKAAGIAPPPTKEKANKVKTKDKNKGKEEEVTYLLMAMHSTGHAFHSSEGNTAKGRLPEGIILDSGASCHMTGDDALLTDTTTCRKEVEMANGQTEVALMKGSMAIKTKNGSTLVLKDVLHLKSLTSTLMSAPTITENPKTSITLKGATAIIRYGDETIATATKQAGGKLFLLDGWTVGKESANVANEGVTNLWHARVGHVPVDVLRRCATLGLGVPKQLATPTKACSECVQLKISKTPAPKTSTRSFKPGECWVSDTKGPFRVQSVGGCAYYTVYVDVGTGYKIVRLVPSTNSATQDANIAEVVAYSERQTGNKVKIFRHDGGPEYKSTYLTQWLATRGIANELSTADNQWQNGVAERAHRTIMEMAMTMLAHAGLARRWWGEAVNTATTILNRIPTTTLDKKTPIEAFSGHKPTLANLKVFGCKAWNMMKDPAKRDKLLPKANPCIFLGYADSSKAYKLYDLVDKKVVHGVHVRFSEDEFAGTRVETDVAIMVDDDDDDDDVNVNPPPAPGNPPPPAHGPPQPSGPKAGQPQPNAAATAPTQPYGGWSTRATPAPAPTQGATPTILVPYPVLASAPSMARPTYSRSASAPANLNIDSATRLLLDTRNKIVDYKELFTHRDRVQNAVPSGATLQLDVDEIDQDLYMLRDEIDSASRAVAPFTAAINQRALDVRNRIQRTGETTPPITPERQAEIRRRSSRIPVLKRHHPDEGYQGPNDSANAASETSLTIDGVEYACTINVMAPTAPQSHKEAMASAEHHQWAEAELIELEQLKSRKTWELVTLPPGRKAIGTRWTYATKTDSSGKTIRYKARLVAKGFAQRAGIDYDADAISSDVVKMGSMRIVLTFATELDYEIEQGDANSAYIQADQPTELYLQQPEGHHDGTNRVGLALKAIYGLVGSGRAWYDHLKRHLIDIGFAPSAADPCVFIRTHNELGPEILCVYVDDFLAVAKTKEQVDQIWTDIESKIDMKRQGPADFLLGIHIERDRPRRTMILSQSAAIRQVLDRFGLHDSAAKQTPEVPNNEDLWEDESKPSVDETTYRSMVGSCMYLMVSTRPDITHAIQRLSRYLHCPREPHLQGAKRLLRYLAGTANIGLRIGGKTTSRPLGSQGTEVPRSLVPQVVGYCDASWAPKPDRKSTSGLLLFLGSTLVSWKSQRQRIVALSSCESEYIAACELTKEITWARVLLSELGWEQTTTEVRCDNQAAIATARSTAITQRSKHIDVRYHWLRENVENGIIKLTFVPTTAMLADSLTKCATSASLENFKNETMATVGQNHNCITR